MNKEQIEKLCFYKLRNEFIRLGFDEKGTEFLTSGWCDLFYGWIKSFPNKNTITAIYSDWMYLPSRPFNITQSISAFESFADGWLYD